MDKEWLTNLKIKDRVVMSSFVMRVSKTVIIQEIDEQGNFIMSDGNKFGSDGYQLDCDPWTRKFLSKSKSEKLR